MWEDRSMNNPLGIHGFSRKLVLGIAVGATALTMLLPSAMSTPAAYATTSGAQSDPAYDFGRGGAEGAGIPACYTPAPDQTRKRMYNIYRPSCFPGHMQ